jgi:hypothetical protein
MGWWYVLKREREINVDMLSMMICSLFLSLSLSLCRKVIVQVYNGGMAPIVVLKAYHHGETMLATSVMPHINVPITI